MMNCDQQKNWSWREKHLAIIESEVRNHFPSGSGWDCGTKFDASTSTSERLVFFGAFHHMDEHGGYAGWTDHTIIVTPSLAFGYKLRITGRNRNGVKEHLEALFDCALGEEVEKE